jgi:hypothetical protein
MEAARLCWVLHHDIFSLDRDSSESCGRLHTCKVGWQALHRRMPNSNAYAAT